MGKYDKDRFQKELAIKFCLSRKMIPFLEVITDSSSDLSDSIEVLTDLDVVGVELAGNGALRWAFFDCKSSAKLSGINRAFWAAGVKQFTAFDQAYVLLKNKPVHNHRLSALSLNVDMHTEQSFKELGNASDEGFTQNRFYQSSIENWEKVFDAYAKYPWSKGLFELSRNAVPLTKAPWNTFRRLIAELRSKRGEFDPGKKEHRAIYLDIVSSTLVLWTSLNHDIRRFYEPDMSKAEFEKVLRYYLWGGREMYEIRQKLKAFSDESGTQADLPAWPKLLGYAGITVSSPESVLECAHLCRELSIRSLVEPNEAFDKDATNRIQSNSRLRQFTIGMSAYLVEAGGMPRDMAHEVETLLSRL